MTAMIRTALSTARAALLSLQSLDVTAVDAS
jgi:hypothetical protein